MINYDEKGNTVYLVVVNHEEQYSIWPDDKVIPNGWKAVGKSGNKQQCLNYIKDIWTNILPLSPRKPIEQHATEQV